MHNLGLYNNRIIEVPGPPTISSEALIALIHSIWSDFTLGRISSQTYFELMLQAYLQIYRGVEQGRTDYRNPMVQWRHRMNSAIHQLRSLTDDPQLHQALDRLAELTQNAENISEDIAWRLIDAFNRLD